MWVHKVGGGGVLAVVYSPNGRTLDFALGTQVQSVCFSRDGLACAVGGSNKQFAVFDVDV